MKRRRLGRTGLVVSEIGMGTMTFGSMADEACESAPASTRRFDAGVNFLDAAEIYPVPPRSGIRGAHRGDLRQVAERAGRRDSVIVATKAAGPGARLVPGARAFGPHRSRPPQPGARRRGQPAAVWAPTIIDLYQTHWPDPGSTPSRRPLEALDRLLEDGKLRVRRLQQSRRPTASRRVSVDGRPGRAARGLRDDPEQLQPAEPPLRGRARRRSCRARAGEPARLQSHRRAVCSAGKYQRRGRGPQGARFARYRDHSSRTQSMTRRFVNERSLAATARVHEIRRRLPARWICRFRPSPWPGALQPRLPGLRP